MLHDLTSTTGSSFDVFLGVVAERFEPVSWFAASFKVAYKTFSVGDNFAAFFRCLDHPVILLCRR